MARVAISSGHGQHVSGAVGLLNERAENVRVTDEVARLLRANGAEVHVFHDNASKSSGENLRVINAFHAGKQRDLDVSIHFNAFQKTDKPMGTEVLHRSQATLAARMSAAIAAASGLINRGAKLRTDLSFLNSSNRPAILIEVCFVDSSADVAIYRAKFSEICAAIAETLHPGSGSATSPSTPQPTAQSTIRQGSTEREAIRLAQTRLGSGLTADGHFGPLTDARARQFQRDRGLVVDGIIGPRTWAELLR